ncbi:MAG: PAS domain S-box protein [Rubrivivax sp.]
MLATQGPDLQRLVIDQSPDALVLCSADQRVQFWSPGATSIFGHAEAEALGRRYSELVVPEDRRDDDERQRAAASNGEVLHQRATLRCRHDGALLYADCSTRALHAADGRLRGWLISTRDVTALTVERDAGWLEDRYRDLLEWVPDAIVIANEIGRIVLFNSQSETMFGVPRAEMIGRPIESLLPQRYGAAHVGHRLRYQHKPQVRRMGAGLELFGQRADGSEFPVEISLSPLGSGEGRFVVSAIRDISQQKAVERELQEKNAALQEAHQAKDRFLASMSHELRTPLNAILGFSGILLMKLPGSLNAEQERQLSIVKHSGEHLLSLINDLLDLAKIQSGAFPLSPEPVDIGSLLGEIHATLQPLADKKGLGLTLQRPEQPVLRQLDRRALSQVLLNLANNAIKFTSSGSVLLELQPAADDGGVSIDVVDTGVGIAEAEQALLFKSFTQVGDPRRRPEGTGLGLHLSARLAELMGGHISVQSVPGVGSRFTLHLAEG